MARLRSWALATSSSIPSIIHPSTTQLADKARQIAALKLLVLFFAGSTGVYGASTEAAAASYGRTPGAFSVSSGGSATYAIPLWTPPGIANLQQSLSLNYSSGGGNGLLGVGWSISGQSSIRRCNYTFAQDSANASPQLNSTDRLCLDGNRLRIVSGTYGADGSTYQTEVATFVTVTAHGSAGNGPAYFTAQGPDGLTYEYGHTTDSAIAAGGGVVASIRTWALDKISDPNSNSIHYSYVNDTTNATYRIQDITYPYTASGGPSYDIHFAYTTRPATDTLTHYEVGYPATETQLLSSISLLTWRRHLRGETKYKVAHKVLEEARLLRYFFYDARNSWYDAGEFPPAYHQMTSEQRTNDDEARAWAYVYEGRYKLVRRQIWVLARLRARSGAVLGDESAAAIETLARKARELGNFMNERVAQYRAGEHIVAQWPDQGWVRRVRDSVEVNPDDHSDRYSREFDEAFEALQGKLRPHT